MSSDPRPRTSKYDDTPVRGFRKLSDVTDCCTQLEDEDEELMFAGEEPTTYLEAANNRVWGEPMKKEIESIIKNDTWELTILPKGHKPIGLKWVYKLKKDVKGKLVKHKVRVVAKGYVQMKGVNFEEDFVSVARIEMVRVILALAATEVWKVHHLDIKSALLHGVLHEDVYVTQPDGLVMKGKEHKVYRLKKALYGLR
uniref:Reverse transcriptase Ty1/copia-type domain-containing protein n=1 Tax=Lactuca sativa TaxID=4236 RepID=A0A9R1UQM4_LACSA|nr:hypothetical protein LSAT_V11C800409060 [Lactuca sativa]